MKLRSDLMFAHCMTFRRNREREREMLVVRHNWQGSPTQYLLRIQGGGKKKARNGQLGYKLHRPLCGSLNETLAEGSGGRKKHTHSKKKVIPATKNFSASSVYY